MNNKSRIRFISISIILGLSFLFLSFLVNKDVFRSLDYGILIFFQSLFARIVDLPFSLITLSGSSEITVFLTVLIFLAVYWKKKSSFTSIFLFFLIYAFELAGKILIFHPKPPSILNRYALDVFFPSSFVVQTAYSFPSGHMARVSFLTTVVIFLVLKFLKSRRQRILLSVVAVFYLFLVFISRIYLAEHWLSDVLGGFFIGSSMAVLAISLW